MPLRSDFKSRHGRPAHSLISQCLTVKTVAESNGTKAPARIGAGVRVSVPAYYFDDADSVSRGEKRWSEETYGANWRTAVCEGIVKEKVDAQSWSIDFEAGDQATVPRRYITLISGAEGSAPKRVRRVSTPASTSILRHMG